MLFNTGTAPIAGAVPQAEYAFFAGTSVVLDDSHYGVRGLPFSAGCFVGLSTTPKTFTPFSTVASNQFAGTIRYLP
jgi:hypothetical protein